MAAKLLLLILLILVVLVAVRAAQKARDFDLPVPVELDWPTGRAADQPRGLRVPSARRLRAAPQHAKRSSWSGRFELLAALHCLRAAAADDVRGEISESRRPVIMMTRAVRQLAGGSRALAAPRLRLWARMWPFGCAALQFCCSAALLCLSLTLADSHHLQSLTCCSRAQARTPSSSCGSRARPQLEASTSCQVAASSKLPVAARSFALQCPTGRTGRALVAVSPSGRQPVK